MPLFHHSVTINRLFLTDGSGFGVARIQNNVIGQREDFVHDAIVKLHLVSTDILRGARTVAKDGVTDKSNFILLTIEDDAVRGMSRSVDYLQGERWIRLQTNDIPIIEILSTVQIDIPATIGA